MNRRQFMQTTAGAAALAKLFVQRAYGQAVVIQTPLPGSQIPQFVDPLPVLGAPIETIIAEDGVEITLNMEEFLANVMPSTFVPANGLPYAGTYVWGYRSTPPPALAGTYIGPVIVATRGIPTKIRFRNSLGRTTARSLTAWLNATDQTLHWANPLGQIPQTNNYVGPIPAVPHLHGGEVPPELDGGPDAWWTSAGTGYASGHAYHTMDGAAEGEAIYRYPNSQEAAPIWFHDHALGITRLNVYAGLAGAYPITDPGLTLPVGLHPVGLQQGATGAVSLVIPLVIQDRMFDTNGQLFFPNLGINPEHPFWIPEFVGDAIAVNGKVWPFLNVNQQRYRFMIIEGSNARAYDLSLIDRVNSIQGPSMWVIATDGGYLDAPVKIDPNATGAQVKAGAQKSLVVMPGERYEIIVDFADPAWKARYAPLGGFPAAGVTLELKNTAKTPFPGGEPAKLGTTGRIIQFRVQPGAVVDASYNPASGIPLRPPMVRLVNSTTGTAVVAYQKKRQLTLNEAMGPGGPLEVLVNNTRYDGKSAAPEFPGGGVRTDFAPILTLSTTEYFSELPNEGETELWEIINLTADAHPIHTHLVQFQLMNRQSFDVIGYAAAYDALFPGSTALDPMTGAAYPPSVFIGGYGPPLDYKTGQPFGSVLPATGILGGNPDVTPFLNPRKNPLIPPLPYEAGWKDVVIMYPGQVTRIMVRFAPTDKLANTLPAEAAFDFNPEGHGYVWHCHIVDHEDNEMMRPHRVAPNPVPRTYIKGTDY